HALDGLDVFALTVVGDPIEHDERISVLQVLFLHLGEADDPLAVLFDHRSRLSQRGLPETLSRGRNVILALEASERFGASLRAQLETSWRSTKIGQMLQNMLGNYPIGRAGPRRQRSLKRRLPNARSGTFKRLAGYHRPKELDRALLDELFTCGFLNEAVNTIIVRQPLTVLSASPQEAQQQLVEHPRALDHRRVSALRDRLEVESVER